MTKEQTESIDIQVSARVLRHIGRGIYRTPAGALKELVSNSYDAGAKKVTINTGYPVFEKIIITDNGSGMSVEQFKDIIQNIGLSDKYAGTKFSLPGTKNNRVIIGQYGIGMLAIGQLAERVIITSKCEKSREGFEATIDFNQFEVRKEEGIERSFLKAQLEENGKRNTEEKKFPIGKCNIKKLKYSDTDISTHFTRLELESVRGLVQKKLSGSIYKEYDNLVVDKKYSPDFESLIKVYREKEGEIRRGQYPYEKLIWELAVYCPVAYPDNLSLDTQKELKHFIESAASADFTVVVDGIELRKPLEPILFSDKDMPVRNTFVWVNEEYSEGKFVSGYLINRQRIRPKTLQGVLVREEGVAIGGYDLTFLEYPYFEAAKFEQLTGELFVSGIASAMNIDRNSFNETDDNYLALVKWFHSKLHDVVFRKIQQGLGKKRRTNKTKEFLKATKSFLKKYNKNETIEIDKLGKEKPLFVLQKKSLVINQDHKLGKLTGSNYEHLLVFSLLISASIIDVHKAEEMLENLSKIEEG